MEVFVLHHVDQVVTEVRILVHHVGVIESKELCRRLLPELAHICHEPNMAGQLVKWHIIEESVMILKIGEVQIGEKVRERASLLTPSGFPSAK